MKTEKTGRSAKARAPRPPVVLGERVRELRDRRGWTQQDLAIRWGVTGNFVSDVERNVKGLNGRMTLALCVALGAEIEHPVYIWGYLVGLLNSTSPPKIT
jgi:transcriptional regulator with XRE-family HTH domain